jgi:hypothetical protein
MKNFTKWFFVVFIVLFSSHLFAKEKQIIKKHSFGVYKGTRASHSIKSSGQMVNLMRGSTAYAYNIFWGDYFFSFDTDTPGTANIINPSTNWRAYLGDFGLGNETFMYIIDADDNYLKTVDIETGIATDVGYSSPLGLNFTGMACDKSTGIMYVSTTDVTQSDLLTVDLSTGETTLIGATGIPCLIDIAIDGDGILYGYDIVNDEMFTIDKTNGNVTLLGPIGFDANFAQSMAWDPELDIVFVAAYNQTTPPAYGELRILDRTTGYCAFVGFFPDFDEVTALGFPGESAPPGAPAAPTDFVLTPDPGGNLSADLNWTNPILTVAGDPLTELLEIRVYRDGNLIYTDPAPAIGGPGNYADTVTETGLYNYLVRGYNSEGEGCSAFDIVWIGEDTPAAVENLLLVAQGDYGYLTWDNPTTGYHSGAFNEPILGYHIERSDGEVFEVTGIVSEYLDNTPTIPGYYSYNLTPYNSIGDGGFVASNTAFLAGASVVIFEGFESGAIPDGWTQIFVNGDGDWRYQEGGGNSNPPTAHSGSYNAYFNRSTNDITKLVTSEIEIGANAELSFWHTQVPWAGDQDELHIYYKTSPGGVWNLLESYTTIVQNWTQRIIPLPDPSSTYYIAFEARDHWGYGVCVDDVIVDAGGSLEMGNVTGIVTDNITNAPIEDASVWITDYPPVATNSNGEYLLEDIFVGTREIYCNADGFYNFSGEVEIIVDITVTNDVGMDPLVFGTLNGTITDIDSSAPIEDAEIHAMSVDDEYEFNASTNSDGYYVIENIIVETYHITGSGFTYIQQTVENVEIVEGETITLDFALEQYTIPTSYWSDFEDDDGGLISNNPNGWQWGHPTSGPAGAYSGQKAWATNLYGNYSVYANDKLETPLLLIADDSYMLKFWHWYEIDNNWDGGNVKISTDGGITWEIIEPEGGYPCDAAYSGNAGIPFEPCYGGQSGGWVLAEFDLSDYSGLPVHFRWHFGSDCMTTYSGWYIDDVQINMQTGTNNTQIVPKFTKLGANYPNPFNPETTISFSIKEDCRVTIDVYNARGQKVKSLVNGYLEAANHLVVWDGKDNNSRKVASGIYIYRMQAGKFISNKKMILMK